MLRPKEFSEKKKKDKTNKEKLEHGRKDCYLNLKGVSGNFGNRRKLEQGWKGGYLNQFLCVSV
jgi:hypothetical protein